jgi:hypothetical protein
MSVLAPGRAFLKRWRWTPATILREVTVDDGMGGTTTTLATVATNAPCAVLRMRRLSVLEAEGSGLLARTLYTINFNPGQDVRTRDQIVTAVATYRVQAVIKGTTFEVGVEAQCALEE